LRSTSVETLRLGRKSVPGISTSAAIAQKRSIFFPLGQSLDMARIELAQTVHAQQQMREFVQQAEYLAGLGCAVVQIDDRQMLSIGRSRRCPSA
jgi:hypothetical protein